WQVQTGMASVPDLLAFGTALALAIDPVLACVEAWGMVQSAMPAHKRLAELRPSPTQSASQAAAVLPKDHPFLLELSSVNFAYPGQKPLFEKLNLALPAHKWSTLLGPSGSGKSSLLHLMAEIVPCQVGQRMLREDLKTTVLVPQKSAFLNMSLQENLCLGRNLESDFLAQILEICQIQPVIAHLPLGLASPMGNQGSLFSGGERQRIALARALLARPQLLLLDEATSELDPLTEAKILTALKKYQPHLTCLWVSHRPASLVEMQHFFALEHGTISVIDAIDGPNV
ncbi:MAG: ATP-binding cassette domain-containing protein, partial [Candidatus Sericytochromatia bacterium]